MPEQYFSPTPQEPISGALAAALQRVLDYASKSGSYQKGREDNPVLPIAADALGLPAWQRTLERLSYGDRLTEGSGETLRLKNDTTAAAMTALPMAQALRKFATPAIEAMPAALSGSRTAQRGAIAVGGNPDLYPYHGTSAAKLLETLPSRDPAKAGIAELSGPSIGISKGGVDTSFAHGQGGGVLLIPRVGAYDPAAYPTTLFNRDAYTPRDRHLEEYLAAKDARTTARQSAENYDPALAVEYGGQKGLEREFLKGQVGARINARLADPRNKDLWAREFPENSTGNWAHDEAIKGSPAFRSFKQFENSPLGAALLMDKRNPDLAGGAIERWQGQGALDKVFGQGFTDFLNKPQAKWDPAVSGDEFAGKVAEYNSSRLAGTGMTFDQFLAQSAPSLRQTVLDWGSTPEHLNQAAREYRGLLKQTPSNYAEIKVAGPTQLSPENWAGAVMLHRPLRSSPSTLTSGGLSYEQQALDTLLPFPVVPHDTSQPDEVLTRLVDALQKQAGPARTQPLGAPYLRFLRNPPD